MEILLWSIIVFLFIGSIVSIVLPFLPDTILLWCGILLYQFTLADKTLSHGFWFALILVSLIIISSDFFNNIFFIKKAGGSKKALFGGIIGLFVGIITMGPVGLLVGPFVLVYIISFLERKNAKIAFKIAVSTIGGFFSSTILKLILQLIILTWFFLII